MSPPNPMTSVLVRRGEDGESHRKKNRDDGGRNEGDGTTCHAAKAGGLRKLE